MESPIATSYIKNLTPCYENTMDNIQFQKKLFLSLFNFYLCLLF